MKCVILGKDGQLGLDLQYTAPTAVSISAYGHDMFDIRDSTSIATIIEAEKPNVIINAAAYTDVDRAELEPSIAFEVNAQGPLNVANVAKKNYSRLLHLSTDYVFDGNSSKPYRPGDKVNPLNIYGQSKLLGEQNLLQVGGTDVQIVRTSGIYSKHGRNFVKSILSKAQSQKDIRVVADQISSPTWSRNLAYGIWALLNRQIATRIVHLTDSGSASWYEFACAICEKAISLGIVKNGLTLSPVASEDHPRAATRPAFSVLDNTQTQELLDHVGESWRTGLHNMLTDYKACSQYP